MSKHLDKAKLLDWLHDKWNQFGANNDLFEQEAIEQVTIEVKRGAFDADESEGTWKATSEFAFRLNDQLEAENQRLRVALEEIRDHAIRFGLATVHMKAEKALSTTTEPTGAERVIGLRAWDKELEMFHDEVVAIDFRLRKIRVFSRSEDDYPSDWLPLERFVLYGINAPEGDENDV